MSANPPRLVHQVDGEWGLRRAMTAADQVGADTIFTIDADTSPPP